MVDHGRLVEAWRGGAATPPLLASATMPATETPPIPLTLAAAEEAQLIWQWMTNGRVRLVSSTAPIDMPVVPIPHLSAA